MKLLHKIRQRYDRWRVLRSLAGTRLLAELVRANPALRFVQVGANDGKMMDPINKSIVSSRWQGWVLEPVPQLFAELEKNYLPLADRVSPVNVAIAGKAGRQPFYFLTDKEGLPPLPDWARGLGSFRREVVVGHGDRLPQLEQYLSEIEVPCLSWRGFCEKYEIADLDLLVVDTEGYDFEIIRQIDFGAGRPVTLVYEHHHFDEATEKACTQLLQGHGYTLFKEGLDTWAVDRGRTDRRYQKLIDQIPRWVRRSPYAEYC